MEIDEFQSNLNHLNNWKKTKIEQLIEKYENVFARDKYDIGIVKNYEARIDLILDKYCSKRPHKYSVEDRREIEAQVAKLLERNLIESF